MIDRVLKVGSAIREKPNPYIRCSGTLALALFADHRCQSPKCFINGVPVWEHVENLGIDDDDVCTFSVSGCRDATLRIRKVILIAHGVTIRGIRVMVRFLAHIASGSALSMLSGSEKTVVASSNMTLCFCLFVSAFTVSHSDRSPATGFTLSFA